MRSTCSTEAARAQMLPELAGHLGVVRVEREGHFVLVLQQRVQELLELFRVRVVRQIQLRTGGIALRILELRDDVDAIVASAGRCRELRLLGELALLRPVGDVERRHLPVPLASSTPFARRRVRTVPGRPSHRGATRASRAAECARPPPPPRKTGKQAPPDLGNAFRSRILCRGGMTWHPTRTIFCLFPIASPRALGTPRDASPPHRTRAPRLRLSGTRKLPPSPSRAHERARRVSSSTHRGNHEKQFFRFFPRPPRPFAKVTTRTADFR